MLQMQNIYSQKSVKGQILRLRYAPLRMTKGEGFREGEVRLACCLCLLSVVSVVPVLSLPSPCSLSHGIQ